MHALHKFYCRAIVPPARSISGATTGLGIATGKADVNDSDPNAVNPGGVPLFRNGSLVGGIGVAGVRSRCRGVCRVRCGDFQWIRAYACRAGRCFHQRSRAAVRESDDAAGGRRRGQFHRQFRRRPFGEPGTAAGRHARRSCAGPLGGLSASDVTQIINNAIATANTTRAVIRLPIGSSDAHGDCRRRSRRHDHRPVSHGG